ncbi:MAG: hypothetical protein M3Q81_00730 [bacterium]|nr:hypothetical protein [bacterium]
MLEKLNRETLTKVAIPKGELLGDFLRLFSLIDLELRPVDKSNLVYTIPNLGLPLLMVAMRARSIGETLETPERTVSFGFNGSDIALEQELQTGETLPQTSQTQPARLVVGTTPNLSDKKQRQNVETLGEVPNARLLTPYPRLAKEWLSEQGLATEVETVEGATEIYWWLDAQCMAILDVVVSGKTYLENDIREVATIMEPVTITSVSTRRPKADQTVYERDAAVFNDLLRNIRTQLRGRKNI